MKLQDQVIKIEQAKRLKELGVEHSVLHHFNGRIQNEAWGNDYYPAFSVAELGEMLPSYITRHGVEATLHSGKSNDGIYGCGYIPTGQPLNTKFLFIRNAVTEAQARGALLIHLLETNIITAEQCNAAIS